MPYIKQEYRDIYATELDNLIENLREIDYPPGHVVYIMYKIVGHWFKDKEEFQTINEIRGVLDSVKSEFDRKFAFQYEDKKIEENGDVDWLIPLLSGDLGACESSCCNPEAVDKEWEELNSG